MPCVKIHLYIPTEGVVSNNSCDNINIMMRIWYYLK